MHIEKNVFENVFNTVMNIEGKTKDNIKAREDLAMFCRRKELDKNAKGNRSKRMLRVNIQRQTTLQIRMVSKLFVNG